MKKLFVLALLFSAVAVQAQDGRHGGHHKGMKHRGEMMQKLNLTEDQKAKFKSANEDFRKEMETLRKDENITVKDFKSRMSSIRKDHQAKIQGILTPEQKDQVKKQREEMKAKREKFARERGEKMKEKLGLTQEQSAKLESSRNQAKEKIKAIREDKGLDEMAKREKVKEVMKAQKDNLKSILTEEQMNKMKEGRKEHHRGKYKEKMKEKSDKDKGVI